MALLSGRLCFRVHVNTCVPTVSGWLTGFCYCRRQACYDADLVDEDVLEAWGATLEPPVRALLLIL